MKTAANIDYKAFVKECMKDFDHDNHHITLLYLASGLLEEYKELEDKISLRCTDASVLSEAGDVLWYATAMQCLLTNSQTHNTHTHQLVNLTFNINRSVRSVIFHNKIEKIEKLSIMLGDYPTALLEFLLANGYDFDIATVEQTNYLKLNERYKRSRDTYYVNKDITKEDSTIHKFLKNNNEKH